MLSSFVGVAILLLATFLSVAPAFSADPAYVLGPGDKVRITVFGQEDLSGEFDVDAAGMLSLPLIQAVPAQGLTPQQVEKEIATKLEPDFLRNPRVNVEVLTYRPFYIYGEVLKPGGYPYVNEMTVHNAIALAGGFTYRARTSYVIIRRTKDGKVTEEEAKLDAKVAPGDVIEVRERYF
ncbi:polysaccharide export protein [Defluviicoccus vanus]|uniref:Polysaccharide export protein n=2 Tax=Defluviicoccus vanus TaxID=111831 RepID=A0A7H1N665_9PROT|nr:polysaccharide export protein [Defluviicoccus vanus]